MRLDIYLREKYGYSREYAKEIIQRGLVSVNGKSKNIKPSFDIGEKDNVSAESTGLKYVGRGGYKLEKAIEAFNIGLKDKICIDVGASTGGFTDCMLQNGAKKVYAVDVGTGQLAEKLREDSRVISMEKTNINDAVIDEKADFISADVSFVSLSVVMKSIYNLLSENGEAVFLIKPQFEAGRQNVGKSGIVKNPKVHKAVLKNIISCVKLTGFSVKSVIGSPIKGGDGNIEYLLYAVKNRGFSEEINVENLIKTVFEKMKKE